MHNTENNLISYLAKTERFDELVKQLDRLIVQVNIFEGVIEKTEEQLEIYAEEVNDLRKRIIETQYEKNKLEKEILEYEKQVMTEE